MVGGLVAAPLTAEGQPTGKVYRVGVILEGGPYSAAIDGLRAGLKELGFEEDKQYVLHIRDMKGERSAIAETARNLEREKVDLIFAVATSVSLLVQRATTTVPIVFYAGQDPAAAGLVKSLATPGGRLTGVTSRASDSGLIGKRLEILKACVPKLRRVLVFYDLGNPISLGTILSVREAARQLSIVLMERPVRSVDELRENLHRLKTGEVDALFNFDSLVTSRVQLIVDTAKARRLATVFNERTSVAAGGLLSYGVSYDAIGRLAAKYVHRVLLGANPADLPVEAFDRIELVINLRTAKLLGLTIPQSLLARADEVIE